MSSKGVIGMLIFCIKRHIDLESRVFEVVKALTIDSHLVEFVYKVESFINNNKQFYFFVHASLAYLFADPVMRMQVEAGRLEQEWIGRVVSELSQRARPFEMGTPR